jgi:histidyl-tRNA synthetase
MGYQTVRGMRDFLPEQAKKKQYIEDCCRRAFEKYGFEPLQTPAVEEFKLLAKKGSGGEAIKEEIYYFKDKGERELGLRFDLTVPLARVMATNPQLIKPFKRYQIARVWRYDRPQAKRYREFTQADADIVGVKGIEADFEIMQVAVEVMRKLELEFEIKVNNRMLLEELALKKGIKKEQVKDAFRLIDKLDKIGQEEVKKEFVQQGINAEILGLVSENSFESVKRELSGKEVLKEFEEFLELCRQNGLKEISFDLALARGLEYYTGNVFEISIKEGPSVGGGGRYDKLVSAYGGSENPAVGISFGVDRLFDALEERLFVGANADIFIALLSKEICGEAFKLADSLRKQDLGVEVDLMRRNLKKNIDYASKKGISFLIVLGENELRDKKFKLKNLGTREEKEFGFEDAEEIRKIVKG